jgi:hypothetical protein
MLGLFMYVLVVEVPEFHLLCFLHLTLFGFLGGTSLEGFWKDLQRDGEDFRTGA